MKSWSCLNFSYVWFITVSCWDAEWPQVGLWTHRPRTKHGITDVFVKSHRRLLNDHTFRIAAMDRGENAEVSVNIEENVDRRAFFVCFQELMFVKCFFFFKNADCSGIAGCVCSINQKIASKGKFARLRFFLPTTQLVVDSAVRPDNHCPSSSSSSSPSS